MLIYLKNKDTLVIDDFTFKCCIGRNGIKKNKVEGDKSTPRGKFSITELYYRKDRVAKPRTVIKKKIIRNNMGWCDESNHKLYNKQILVNKFIHHEKLYRKDSKYDYFLVLNYNRNKIVPNKGSAIFLHLTKNYSPTAGCIAIKKKDFEILLKIINKKTQIKII
jgi:L,D-peptidoglycan transpeptidase YkuD (ErfK/YbiS/YcfS/YnhG family)